ncbi:hypothetical protein Naga_102193g1 [Nannochloropsis gaditana]|uniref:Uncharacterized protein n=1 Tax=Nannochloropsis gaditana TaxID=72520 RepID=W7SZX5_9STRA|nr:hypothetical protein Naga_102193g1 [Nannochloropsis gaditana]
MFSGVSFAHPLLPPSLPPSLPPFLLEDRPRLRHLRPRDHQGCARDFPTQLLRPQHPRRPRIEPGEYSAVLRSCAPKRRAGLAPGAHATQAVDLGEARIHLRQRPDLLLLHQSEPSRHGHESQQLRWHSLHRQHRRL